MSKQVVAFYVTYATQYISGDWAYRLPFLIQMIPGFILAGMVLVMPFSPRWLCLRGRDTEALHTLSKLRQLPITDARVQAEWILIRADIQSQNLAQELRHPSLSNPGTSSLRRELLSWMDCFRPGVFQRTSKLRPRSTLFVGRN